MNDEARTSEVEAAADLLAGKITATIDEFPGTETQKAAIALRVVHKITDAAALVAWANRTA